MSREGLDGAPPALQQLLERVELIARRMEEIADRTQDLRDRLVRIETIAEFRGTESDDFKRELAAQKKEISSLSIKIAAVGVALSQFWPILKSVLAIK